MLQAYNRAQVVGFVKLKVIRKIVKSAAASDQVDYNVLIPKMKRKRSRTRHESLLKNLD